MRSKIYPRESVFYCATSPTLPITIRISVATLQTHSLHLSLTLLLHSTLNATLFHMRIGGYFRLNIVALEDARERQTQHKKGHNEDARNDYYYYCIHFSWQKFTLFRTKVVNLCDICAFVWEKQLAKVAIFVNDNKLREICV